MIETETEKIREHTIREAELKMSEAMQNGTYTEMAEAIDAFFATW